MRRRRTILTVAAGLAIIFAAVFLMNLQTPRGSTDNQLPVATPPLKELPAVNPPSSSSEPVPALPENSKGSSAPAPPSSSLPPSARPDSSSSSVTDEDLGYLRERNLLLPVQGIKPAQLHDTYNEARSEGRVHNALDIMAPQGAPVLAASDGTIIKLFQSVRGGITLYELDPSRKFIFYYAHLSKYADGISEGKEVKRGDVIAYVGDTGNAGPGNFHLHFAISKVSDPRKWSSGEPINPYPLLSGKR